MINFICQNCSSTDKYKSAKGLCRKCYRKFKYSATKEEDKKAVKKWRKENYSYVLTYNKEYKKNNPDIIRPSDKKSKHKYRLINSYADVKVRQKRVRQSTPAWLTRDQRKLMLEMYKKCPEGYHVDHVIPLKAVDLITGEHIACGLHVPWNLQYLSSQDNLKKGNRIKYLG